MVSRRPALRVDLTNLAAELNQLEQSQGRWVFDGVDQITPRLHLEGSLNTSISPDVILLRVEEHLRVGAPAWDLMTRCLLAADSEARENSLSAVLRWFTGRAA